ncbi:Crp/Fnr family transcriptional regulator [Neobacillus dielmonensis]|uniref:Crp/Fnr family transcriptional regulator n=1 Tax=Neobacillus dielmonensis TaxID=1347369 RepID=UPI0005AB62C7|nr:Crp/Fnr family transcriptional regulator [Neobacillus dielmonensis]
MPGTLKPTKSIEIRELLHIADRTMKVEKGQYLFQEGQDAGELFLIVSGKIQISKLSPEGRELSLRICSENEICGELTLFTQSPKYLLSALMLEDGEIAVVRKETIEQKLFEDSALAFEFIKWLSDHLRKTQMKFRDLILYGKKGALYSTLIRMTNSYGIEKTDGILINLSLTNQELANFCGTTRESINHLLKDLKHDGLISIYKKKITVHNLQYLRQQIGCENCPVVFCSIE